MSSNQNADLDMKKRKERKEKGSRVEDNVLRACENEQMNSAKLLLRVLLDCLLFNSAFSADLDLHREKKRMDL
jgi:hypothetical protein